MAPTGCAAAWARVGLIQERQDVAARHMSGGERARLSIALILVDKPNILILDEPTNHLDIDARDALAEALNGFGGCVILISHDRRLLETCSPSACGWSKTAPCASSTTIWTVTAKAFGSTPRAARRTTSRRPAKADKKGDRQLAAARRKEIAELRKAAAAAERTLEKLTEKMAQLEKSARRPGFLPK